MGDKKSPVYKCFTQLWLLHQPSAFQSEAPWDLNSLNTHHTDAHVPALSMIRGVSVRKNSILPRTSPPLNSWEIYTRK